MAIEQNAKMVIFDVKQGYFNSSRTKQNFKIWTSSNAIEIGFGFYFFST